MTPSTAHRVSLIARAATVVGLLLLLYLGVRGDSSGGVDIRLTAGTAAGALAAELAAMTSGRVVYTDSTAPSRAVTALMSAAPKMGRDVVLVLPERSTSISVRPPVAPVAQRRTALSISVHGEAGSEVRLTIDDDAGASDSVTVSIGPDGIGTAALGIEPARAGLNRWTARVAGSTTVARAAAWVRPAEPLDVLVDAATPDWETRYLVRALEAGGARVVVRQTVGADLVVTSSGTPARATLDEVEPFDVVVSTTTEGYEQFLRNWVSERGGGLLLLRRGGASRAVHGASDLRWTAPAEWLPLPARPIDVSATPVASIAVPDGGHLVPVGTLPDPTAVVVYAATPGRGRLVVSGLDSWPWVLAGGASQAHADYWQSVVEWLAGGLRDDQLLVGAPTQPYEAWEGRLDRADGRSSTLRMVPTGAGSTVLRLESGDTVGAAIAVPGDEALDWLTAAAIVGRSGGALVEAERAPTARGAPLGDGPRRDWPAFLLLGALMLSGWGTRRVTGLR